MKNKLISTVLVWALITGLTGLGTAEAAVSAKMMTTDIAYANATGYAVKDQIGTVEPAITAISTRPVTAITSSGSVPGNPGIDVAETVPGNPGYTTGWPIRECREVDELMKSYNAAVQVYERYVEAGQRKEAERALEKIKYIKEMITKARRECNNEEPVPECPPQKELDEEYRKLYVGYKSAASETESLRYRNAISEQKTLIAMCYPGPIVEPIPDRPIPVPDRPIPLPDRPTEYKPVPDRPTEYKPVPDRPIVDEPTSDIVKQYRKRLDAILIQESDADDKIYKLKALRKEIDSVIRKLFMSKDKVDARSVEGLVEKITVRPNEIKADELSIRTNTAIVTSAGSSEVEVIPSSDSVMIVDNGVIAKSTEVSITREGISVGGVKVKVSPKQASDAVSGDADSISLGSENGRAVYTLYVSESKKLLGIIPVTVEKTVKVDGETKEIIEEDEPWWTMLTI